MKMRAKALNNDRQIERMVRDKLRSLHRSLLYSYQSAWIQKVGSEEKNRALINPDKIKFDYDEKIVSVDPKWGYKPGDVFEWKNTGTYWLILKQELTEVAYFRGNCRRCQALEVFDKETGEVETYWMAIRGPVETKINTIQKAGIVVDVPNLTINAYVTKTDKTIKLFERYQRFSFAGRYWKVTAPDSISTPGILEFTAEEDYDCDHDELIIEIKDPNPQVEEYENDILGDTFIYPLDKAIYSIKMPDNNNQWIVKLSNENKDIDDVLEYKILGDGTSIEIIWTAMISGSFEIHYGDLTKTVIVQSLF